MPRPTRREPTDGELEILNILWEAGPAELGVVCGALRRRRQVATTTVATMLKVMLEKGLVRRTQGPKGYLWAARVTRKSTRRKLLRKLIASVFDGSARHLVEHMVEHGNLSDKDRADIRELLELDTAEDQDQGKEGRRRG